MRQCRCVMQLGLEVLELGHQITVLYGHRLISKLSALLASPPLKTARSG